MISVVGRALFQKSLLTMSVLSMVILSSFLFVSLLTQGLDASEAMLRIFQAKIHDPEHTLDPKKVSLDSFFLREPGQLPQEKFDFVCATFASILFLLFHLFLKGYISSHS